MTRDAGSKRDDGLLRWALRGNATFSTVSGLAFALAAGAIGDFLGGVPAAEVRSVGLSLLGFAALLVWLAGRSEIPAALVLAVVAADLAWVLGTVGVVVADVFTPSGEVAAVSVANVVLACAVLQWLGLRRAQATVRAEA